MANKVFNIIISLAKQGGADKETISGLVGIKNAMTQGMAVAGAMVGAYYAVDKVLDETVSRYVTLAQEVEKFRNLTGMTAEDASRLKETFDDLGISQDAVTTAFKYAENNGFKPSIESILQMQKEYQNLAKGQERVQFLSEQFGAKGGLNLQKFFETGDLQKMLDTVGSGFVISDEGIASAEEYRLAINDLNDSVEEFKLNFGKGLLPMVIALTQSLNTQTTAWKENGAAVGGTAGNDASLAAAMEKYRVKMEELTNSTGTMVRTGNEFNDVLTNVDGTMTRVGNNFSILGDGAGNANTEITDLTDNFKFLTDAAGKYQKINKDIADIEQQIADARAQGYTSTGAGTVLGDLTADLDAAKAKSQELTNQMVLDFYQMQIAADGVITQEEIDSYFGLAENLGLIDDEAHQAALSALELAQKLAALQDKTVTLTTTFVSRYITEGEPYNPGYTPPALHLAGGGEFDADMARVGEQGEEWLVRNAAGDVVVLPNDMVRKMRAWGISPGMGFVGGGVATIDDSGGARYHHPIKSPPPSVPDYGGYGGNTYLEKWYRENDLWTGGDSGGSSPSIPAAIAAVSQENTVAAVEAVAPVVTGAMQTFQAASQQNSQQVSRQTAEAARSNAEQIAVLKSILNALEGQAEQLAAEIQKGKK